MQDDYSELVDKFSLDVEYEYTQRVEELAKCENCVELATTIEEDKETYRKMLILMVYSYFEGFCKKALLIYVDYINRLGLKTKQVKSGLASLSLEQDFDLLSNQNHKPIPLRGELLDKDSKLYAISRRMEFMEKYTPCMDKPVVVSEATIDTESNLKSYVLKSLLYKVDIDYTIVDPYQRKINDLLAKRNAIAHGDLTRGIDKPNYNEYKSKAIELMQNIKQLIIDAFTQKAYLREE